MLEFTNEQFEGMLKTKGEIFYKQSCREYIARISKKKYFLMREGLEHLKFKRKIFSFQRRSVYKV